MLKYNLVNSPWHHFCLLLFVCTSTVFMGDRKVVANENNQERAKPFPLKRKSSSTYCGVHCLYTVMKLENKEVEFRGLLKPEYIGSRMGSSFKELKKAAEDHGMYALPAMNLTSRELCNCSHSVVLHVKFSEDQKNYNHFELYLGTKNGKAMLFDPPEAIRLVPFGELAPRWDGNGLIVSTEPIDTNALFAIARKRFIFYLAIAIAVILVIHLSRRWLPKTFLNSRSKLFGLSMGQAAGFAITALLCGMLYHFANDVGLLANANATAAIQEAHAGNFIPKISERKVHKLLGNGTVFIDARLSRDYKAGHLDGAISVPVDSNDIELKKATANIAKDARVVLYCQSSGCKYAEIVAIKLKDDGFNNISIYKGGWAEWVAKNGDFFTSVVQKQNST